MTDARRLLGEAFHRPIKADELESIAIPDSGGIDVSIECDDVSACCPVTGQPDTYTLTISYTARGDVLETKALKLYLWGYRDMGIACEALADQVALDLARFLAVPVLVSARQHTRGGMRITATAIREP
jgi:7-cyano-7-deazaguanine reductase